MTPTTHPTPHPPLQGYPISFNIYAHSPQEVEQCRQAIIGFINVHRAQHRAVTAQKLTQALLQWDRNPIIRNQIIKYFQSSST